MTRRFNHQNDIFYRNVALNKCLQFVHICSDFVPLLFQNRRNTYSFETIWAISFKYYSCYFTRFTWNRNWSLRPIEVCGETIELSNEVKVLGITLDSKLTFNTHIDNVTKKCIGTLFQCERAMGPTWGLSPK